MNQDYLDEYISSPKEKYIHNSSYRIKGLF